jgi:hypothetical protein
VTRSIGWNISWALPPRDAVASPLALPGRVVITAGDHAGDPAAMLAAVTACLDSAAASARRLHQALDAAQNHLAWAAAASAGE